MELSQALYTTRAMRRVKPDPIPDEILAKLLDAAVRAPSGGNTQSWRFLLVSDPAKRIALQKLYREGLTDLNATKYKAVMDLIKDGDPSDPEVIQAKKTNASAEWLADNLHLVPTLLFAWGKPNGESSIYPASVEPATRGNRRRNWYLSHHTAVQESHTTGSRATWSTGTRGVGSDGHDHSRLPNRSVGCLPNVNHPMR